MKVQLLKNLIKEAVREVLIEDLKEILNESNLNVTDLSSIHNNTVSSLQLPNSREHVHVNNSTPSSPLSSIESILEETRRSMTGSDFSNIIGESRVFQESEFSETNLQSSINTYDLESAPKVGIDLSNLDFVKKAAAIYNLSNQKK